MSQTRAVLSALVLTSCLPADENATCVIAASCPFFVTAAASFEVSFRASSQILIVPSTSAVTSSKPFPEKVIAETGDACAESCCAIGRPVPVSYTETDPDSFAPTASSPPSGLSAAALKVPAVSTSLASGVTVLLGRVQSKDRKLIAGTSVADNRQRQPVGRQRFPEVK